jgi:hypothetical protein
MANGMREKEELKPGQGRNLAEKLYTNLSLQQSTPPQLEETSTINKKNRLYTWIWKLGWRITQFGIRVQMAGFRRVNFKEKEQ